MRLTAEEREVILVYNDASRSWSLHCDSRTYGTRLRRWLRSLGIEPIPNGAGFQAEGIPSAAVSFLGRSRRGRPLSDAHRAALLAGGERARRARVPRLTPPAAGARPSAGGLSRREEFHGLTLPACPGGSASSRKDPDRTDAGRRAEEWTR